MEKNTEQEIRNRINENAKEAAAKLQEKFNEAFVKATEAAKKEKQKKLGQEAARCFLAALGCLGLCIAEAFGLISPILATPVYAFALVYIGWHLCKYESLRGRK